MILTYITIRRFNTIGGNGFTDIALETILTPTILKSIYFNKRILISEKNCKNQENALKEVKTFLVKAKSDH